MKNIIFTLLLILVVSVLCCGQDIPVAAMRQDADTSTTAWDSVYIGPQILRKCLEVINDGSVDLYLAFMNDTSAGQYISIKSDELFIYKTIQGVNFIRTKSASTTCLRRVRYYYLR